MISKEKHPNLWVLSKFFLGGEIKKISNIVRPETKSIVPISKSNIVIEFLNVLLNFALLFYLLTIYISEMIRFTMYIAKGHAAKLQV